MRLTATLIDRIAHSAATADGRRMALTMADTEANHITLGIACDLLPRLIEESARALVDRERVNRRGWDPRAPIAVTWWNLNRDEAADGFLLSPSFGSGAQLSFTLTRDMAAALRDNLSGWLDLSRNGERGFGARHHTADPQKRQGAPFSRRPRRA
jgi:hypothetical protein